jgi:hypothetical protein
VSEWDTIWPEGAEGEDFETVLAVLKAMPDDEVIDAGWMGTTLCDKLGLAADHPDRATAAELSRTTTRKPITAREMRGIIESVLIHMGRLVPDEPLTVLDGGRRLL